MDYRAGQNGTQPFHHGDCGVENDPDADATDGPAERFGAVALKSIGSPRDTVQAMTYDWSDAPDRLARLAVAPDANEIFGAAGAAGHGWRLEPALSTAELSEIEGQAGVVLPEEYRAFLLAAGRGGAGPSYGLFPVRRVEGRWRWEGDGADLTVFDTLAQPFPYVTAFNPADGLPDPPDAESCDSAEAFQRRRG